MTVAATLRRRILGDRRPTARLEARKQPVTDAPPFELSAFPLFLNPEP